MADCSKDAAEQSQPMKSRSSQQQRGPSQEEVTMTIRTKLSEMQESVEVYERLGLKAEYLYAYRMLIFMILQAGDFNALARELAKFVGDAALFEASNLDRYKLVLTRLWNGQSPNDAEKEKGIITRTGDGLVGCGLDKIRVFQSCVLPPLKEFYKSAQCAQGDIINKVLVQMQKDGVQF